MLANEPVTSRLEQSVSSVPSSGCGTPLSSICSDLFLFHPVPRAIFKGFSLVQASGSYKLCCSKSQSCVSADAAIEGSLGLVAESTWPMLLIFSRKEEDLAPQLIVAMV